MKATASPSPCPFITFQLPHSSYITCTHKSTFYTFMLTLYVNNVMLGCLLFVNVGLSGPLAFITLINTNTSHSITVMYGNTMYGGSHKTCIEEKNHSILNRSCMHISYVIFLVLSLNHVPNYTRQCHIS